jgi:hypothetical protein
VIQTGLRSDKRVRETPTPRRRPRSQDPARPPLPRRGGRASASAGAPAEPAAGRPRPLEAVLAIQRSEAVADLRLVASRFAATPDERDAELLRPALRAAMAHQRGVQALAAISHERACRAATHQSSAWPTRPRARARRDPRSALMFRRRHPRSRPWGRPRSESIAVADGRRRRRRRAGRRAGRAAACGCQVGPDGQGCHSWRYRAQPRRSNPRRAGPGAAAESAVRTSCDKRCCKGQRWTMATNHA